MYHSFIKVDQGHHVPYIYLFGALYSEACVKQRFMTSTICENAWCKLVLTLTETSSMLVWPSDIVCMMVVDTLNACSDLNVHLYDSPEYFITARRSYASAVLVVVILSVCPSVSPSDCHTRALWQIQRTYRWYFYTTWNGNHSSFLMSKISAKFQLGHPKRGRQIEVG